MIFILSQDQFGRDEKSIGPNNQDYDNTACSKERKAFIEQEKRLSNKKSIIFLIMKEK